MLLLYFIDLQDFHWRLSIVLSDIVLGYREVYACPEKRIGSSYFWN